MKLFITAKPNSKKEYVKKIDSTHFKVAVCEPPVSGKANKAIIRAISTYFMISPSQLTITSGEKSKHKIIKMTVALLPILMI